jgi:hypothetical protein
MFRPLTTAVAMCVQCPAYPLSLTCTPPPTSTFRYRLNEPLPSQGMKRRAQTPVKERGANKIEVGHEG